MVRKQVKCVVWKWKQSYKFQNVLGIMSKCPPLRAQSFGFCQNPRKAVTLGRQFPPNPIPPLGNHVYAKISGDEYQLTLSLLWVFFWTFWQLLVWIFSYLYNFYFWPHISRILQDAIALTVFFPSHVPLIQRVNNLRRWNNFLNYADYASVNFRQLRHSLWVRRPVPHVRSRWCWRMCSQFRREI